MRGRLTALETVKEGENARVEGLAHATEKATEQAANATQNVRQATQALDHLGMVVYMQQNANDAVRKWVKGMEASHAQQAAFMAGELKEIKCAIKMLNQRVAEATLSPVVWSKTPRTAN